MARPPSGTGSSSEGTPSGTLVVLALGVFALLFIAASFIDPAAFTSP